ncbi:MAG: glutamate-5-semialdehyde dehydrogenase [Gammaproteobacteria bacterium]|nr:MAG: glutamate-5-semialdehyde dehydrogenase [Gammaproteobacteria bacterium]
MNTTVTATPDIRDTSDVQVPDPVAHVRELGQAARAAAASLAAADTETRARAIIAMADAIDADRAALAEANRQDLEAAGKAGIGAAFLDRLELTEARIDGMIAGLRNVAAQKDPVGSMSASERQPSGLVVAKMRVPLGVIGVIYESRPNVTADAAGICVKSGNAVILRGGSEAKCSNRVIAQAVQRGLVNAGLPAAAVQLVATTDRAAVGALLRLDEFIDVVIPRGGKGLVQRISDEARVPVIKHLDGICHVYIDKDADAEGAVNVAVNAKAYRYGICGAMETLLVHAERAAELLPILAEAFREKGVELRGCERCRAIVPDMLAASDADWDTEYLAPILSIRVVDAIDTAIAHIARHGSGHTDAIVTDNIAAARRFTQEVDSSSVMVNAATCFADGGEYGLGAEIGISTNRMHVRGPVGVLGLTTEKYVVTGDYTTRS